MSEPQRTNRRAARNDEQTSEGPDQFDQFASVYLTRCVVTAPVGDAPRLQTQRKAFVTFFTCVSSDCTARRRAARLAQSTLGRLSVEEKPGRLKPLMRLVDFKPGSYSDLKIVRHRQSGACRHALFHGGNKRVVLLVVKARSEICYFALPSDSFHGDKSLF